MCVLQRMAEMERENKRLQSMVNDSDALKAAAIARAKVSAHVHAWVCLRVPEHACMSRVHTARQAFLVYV